MKYEIGVHSSSTVKEQSCGGGGLSSLDSQVNIATEGEGGGFGGEVKQLYKHYYRLTVNHIKK